MRYQWGRKDSFTFATSNKYWGTGFQYGMYPVKIYTIDGVLIYQENNGRSNTDKQPAGGIIESLISATSIMETIKNPIIFYSISGVIDQVVQTKSLWDYYWTSYSRGTDGNNSIKSIHNNYLDGYKSQRLKSIYDPCPYGFRVSSNGTYNQFMKNTGWVEWSYIGGASWILENNPTWFPSIGWRGKFSCVFSETGRYGIYASSIPSTQGGAYTIEIISWKAVNPNYYTNPRSSGYSVRCIEE